MIKFSKNNIDNKTLNLVKKTIKSGWLTHGKNTQKFENEFKKFTESKFAVSVSSCTAALHLSCLAAGFKKGDEVIVTSMSHTATSHSVEYTGAKVVFADINLYDGNISVESIKKKINKKTRGIIIVHMTGFACEIKEITKICKEFNLKLIEDCAHSLGTFYQNRHVGLSGISGCFSFYPTKQITTGEGGMIITNDKKVYELLKTLKAFGIDKDVNERKKAGFYDVNKLGYNYRMTDFQAALGLSQLKIYNQLLKKRIKNVQLYYEYLKKCNNIRFECFRKYSSYFVFQIFVKNRDKLTEILKKNNIQYSIHYATPLPLMNYYKKKYNYRIKDFKNASLYASTNLSLPAYPKIKASEIKKICNIIYDFQK
jgi:dTDP-4-amino-4,6-dideoxygalactose transaminase